MSAEDEDFFARPKPPPSQHVIGEPLDRLSVDELAARIEMLQAEIARLEQARGAKTASRDAAATFFKS